MTDDVRVAGRVSDEAPGGGGVDDTEGEVSPAGLVGPSERAVAKIGKTKKKTFMILP